MIATRTALTEAQRAAVDHVQGPLLIVAGAGTGKTRVLVERYRRLRQAVSYTHLTLPPICSV